MKDLDLPGRDGSRRPGLPPAGREDGPQLHLHAVLGLSDGSTRGGHLLAGRVWPTLEVIISETSAGLRKTYRPDIGLALIDLEKRQPQRHGRPATGSVAPCEPGPSG